MDENKLYPQVIAVGQLYKIITETCPQAEIPDPEMRPLRTYTMVMLRLHQNRKKLSPKLEKILADLSDKINVEDWDGIFNTPVSADLKNAFYSGYYKSMEKTKIAVMRKSKHMTQAQLAKLVGVTQKDISRWEQGTVKAGAENLKKLANALDCKIDDLI